ncbi:hypothetical protein DFJ74DRAFT_757613 [Hyaloraphidium curvatum]|nr:hypothetical protein DFJ74DRAFT_757613 [Hyaloraphidium curvatum]
MALRELQNLQSGSLGRLRVLEQPLGAARSRASQRDPASESGAKTPAPDTPPPREPSQPPIPPTKRIGGPPRATAGPTPAGCAEIRVDNTTAVAGPNNQPPRISPQLPGSARRPTVRTYVQRLSVTPVENGGADQIAKLADGMRDMRSRLDAQEALIGAQSAQLLDAMATIRAQEARISELEKANRESEVRLDRKLDAMKALADMAKVHADNTQWAAIETKKIEEALLLAEEAPAGTGRTLGPSDHKRPKSAIKSVP